jgi:hypothetical protein
MTSRPCSKVPSDQSSVRSTLQTLAIRIPMTFQCRQFSAAFLRVFAQRLLLGSCDPLRVLRLARRDFCCLPEMKIKFKSLSSTMFMFRHLNRALICSQLSDFPT